MRVQALKVEGFRSLRSFEIDLKSVSVLIGPNGSGKSNFLFAIEMLSAGMGQKLAETIIRQGGMIPMLWDGATDRISFRLRTDPVDPNTDPEWGAVTFECELRQLGKGSSYVITAESLQRRGEYDAKMRSQPFKWLERTSRHAVLWSTDEHRLERLEQSVGQEQPSNELDEQEFLIAQVVDPANYPVAFAFRRFCTNWVFYRNLQVGPEAVSRQSAIVRKEASLNSDGSNLVSVLHTLYTQERGFRQAVNDALEAAFPADFEELSFPPAEDGRIQLRWRSNVLRRELAASDLSDGTIRYLMLLCLLLAPQPPPLILIDEPEIGLHPRMVATVAELMKDASRRTQLIVATHSAELVSAFSDNPEAVVVFESDHGASQARRLDPTELREWLRAYSLGDLWLSGELDRVR